MEVFRCTVQVKQQLTKEACRYYLRHNRAHAWRSPIFSSLLLMCVVALYVHLFWLWRNGAPPDFATITVPFTIVPTVLFFIIWISLMPSSLRYTVNHLLKKAGAHGSEAVTATITPLSVRFASGYEIWLGPSVGILQKEVREDARNKSQKHVLTQVGSIHESQNGLYFTIMFTYRLAFFISRDAMPPEEYGALREMLKERFQSRYYEI